MNDIYRSRSALFLMEQLIAIIVFAICAAVCVSIFADSYIMARDSADMSGALLMAESGAECFKAARGNAGQVAGILGGRVVAGGSVVVCYDEKWKACAEYEAVFRMKLDRIRPEGTPASLIVGIVSVEKSAGEEIISLTVAGRKTG